MLQKAFRNDGPALVVEHRLPPLPACWSEKPGRSFTRVTAAASRNELQIIAILKKAAIIISPRARHLEIAPQFIADKTNRLLDFGWCLLRLNAGAQ